MEVFPRVFLSDWVYLILKVAVSGHFFNWDLFGVVVQSVPKQVRILLYQADELVTRYGVQVTVLVNDLHKLDASMLLGIEEIA